MSRPPRSELVIPDHEVLRKIGGGAYGEVWMARGVTGAYRAVKVVYREDFEDERGFEREFEGILKFEPISRDHPGFVNILHVGRSDAADAFYYYVMELGDDIREGRNINPVEYEARTLRSDITSNKGKAHAVGPCIDAGIRLAEALANLHGIGLAHRDVKPANIIFVGGKAKLADIGLVADRGQRTFVGTEGFVPPEGPGSAQADVYSLGKVLYELATGKDRLQFPELPEELHPDTEPKQWFALNQVICDICEPKISKRTITSAEQLAVALKRIDAGKKLRMAGLANAKSVVLWALLVGFSGYALYLSLPYIKGSDAGEIGDTPIPAVHGDTKINTGGGGTGEDPITEVEKYCRVTFRVNAEEAEVYDLEGNLLGYIEDLRDVPRLVGSTIQFILKAPGYQDLAYNYIVPNEDYDIPDVIEMKLDLPPMIGKEWYDSIGIRYSPVGKQHLSNYLKPVFWDKYTESNLSVIAPNIKDAQTKVAGKVYDVQLLPKQLANEMADWLTRRALEQGRLNEAQEIVVQLDQSVELMEPTLSLKDQGLYAVKFKAQDIPYAKFVVETVPAGAKVKLDDKLLGLSDESWSDIRAGKKTLEISKDGYKTFVTQVEFFEGKLTKLPPIVLEKNDSLIFGKPWQNKLGMKFVPLNQSLMVSAWETRVKDYQAYITATGGKFPFPQKNRKPNEPVVFVSVEDANKFAAWLTQMNRSKGLITDEHTYRLPTDREWSLFVGIEEPEGKGIQNLATLNKDIYPWQGGWKVVSKSSKRDKLVQLAPGAVAVGNFSDEIRKKWNPKTKRYFAGYSDGHSGTSPVGAYSPNKMGIYDLAGNVHEWVSDTLFDGKVQVARGSSYKSFRRDQLTVSNREYPDGKPNDNTGFRLVLEYKKQEVEEPDELEEING